MMKYYKSKTNAQQSGIPKSPLPLFIVLNGVINGTSP